MLHVSLAIIGHPTSHSLSPILMNYWLKQRGVLGKYIKVDLPEISTQKISELFLFLKSALPQSSPSAPEESIVGVNVTMPHKKSILNCLNNPKLSPCVAKIGAINMVKNTIVNEKEVIYCDNTDASALLNAIHALPLSVFNPQKAVSLRALIIGSGGASKASHFALSQLGLKDITTISWRHLTNQKEWIKTQKSFDVFIQATPLGMIGYPDFPWNNAFDTYPGIVVEWVYRPTKTQAINDAKSRGCTVISGMELFVRQAALSFQAWTNIPIDSISQDMEWLTRYSMQLV